LEIKGSDTDFLLVDGLLEGSYINYLKTDFSDFRVVAEPIRASFTGIMDNADGTIDYWIDGRKI
jgi:hypothetical protein